jgi:hypothetical protein
MDLGERLDKYLDLKFALESLHKKIVLTGFAIQAYQYTPLGHNLANTISPDVRRCCEVLQKVLEEARKYRQALEITRIRSLWHQM